MSIIRWEDPPPRTNGGNQVRHDHELTAAQLRRQPGQWALIYVGSDPAARVMASLIAHGRYRMHQPAGSYEAVKRHVDGEHRVYARYVGGES